MNNAIKLETEANMECFIYLVIGEVVCHETDVARQLEQGKSFAEHNKVVYDVALAVAKSYDEQLQLRMDAYARERQALEDVKKLDLEKQRLKKKLFNVKKQLYCSDLNQKKEHSKFLDALNKYHCELNRRKKLEAKIKELEADLEEGGFNDERNFI